MPPSDTTVHNDPIGPNDIISVNGQYLYKRDGTRFFVKGIAFPVSIVATYNATAWVDVLKQLHALDLAYNTVRIYRMDPALDYSEFFHAAASLGVYVIVPLTAESGPGVLARTRPAPDCYDNRHLFDYGVACLDNFLQYPNVLAGVLGNEVMNTHDSWTAAPCIKAYGRDLKLYMQRNNRRPLPLIYAAQHSGIGAKVGDVGTMLLTLNYLTCKSQTRTKSDTSALVDEDLSSSSPVIDIFGVNVESWCSSQQDSFMFNEDGTSASSYYSLWLGLHQSTVPLVFTEMGCSHAQFDRDNGLATPQGTRDWKQVSVVLHEMSDTWSGFCAYAYDGNTMFRMFQGGPWRDEPLEPTQDFFNFRDALKHAADHDNKRDPPIDYERVYVPPSCQQVHEELQSCCNLDLYPFSRIPSFALMDLEGAPLQQPHYADITEAISNNNNSSSSIVGSRPELVVVMVAVVAGFILLVVSMIMRKGWRSISRHSTYQSIS
jgi:hypothetical protein